MSDTYLCPIQVLYAIKKRPTMFLSKKSIISLGDFVNGYSHCLNGVQTQYNEETLIYKDFYHYLYCKFSLPNDLSIYSALRQLCSYDEEKAFDFYFEELDSFLKQRNVELSDNKE